MMSSLRSPAVAALWALAAFAGAWADNVTFIPAGDSWRFFKGTRQPSEDLTAWQQTDFNDSDWLTGTEPFFYGEPLLGTTLDDMFGGYTSVYLRKEFDVASSANLSEVNLRVLSDDGFVAWINGQEIARFNVPDGDLFAGFTANGALSEPLSIETYPVNQPAQVLRNGRNILAIHAFNASLSGSSDFVLSATLDGVIDNTPPTVVRILPTPGAVVRSLSSFEIQFSRPVAGLEATDLLVAGSPATGVTEVSPGQFLFTFHRFVSGDVTLAFRPGHGITDLAVPPHPFAGGEWSFTVDPNAPAPGVLLNEFMADNERTLRDEDGDRSDWIELFNSSAATVNLTGWWLTDDPVVPKKWTFPVLSLPANSFLVLFASGKDRTNNSQFLHTNFRLSNNAGGFVSLADDSGKAVSSLTNYPAQFDDISYGRAPGAPNLIGYFVAPTPGKANSASGPGFAPPVEFGSSSRTYRGELALSLTTTNANAVIRYTTDGSLPSALSPQYTNPLVLSNAVQVRALATQAGLLPGPVRSETFIPITDPVSAFTSDLPVMVIHHFDRGRPSANTDTFAHVQIYEPDTNGVTSLTNAPTLTSRATIAARGSSTEGYGKVSMKLEFQDELGFGRALGPLGLPEDPDWVLYAPNNFEPILVHNPYAHQLSREIGRYSPRTRFVEVYFAQRGLGPMPSANYHGIYVLEEKIKFDRNRVDEPKLYPGQNSQPEVSGGYLMKVDRPDPGDNGLFGANQWCLYVSPKEEEMILPDRAGQRNYLQSYMDAFGNALYGGNYRNPVTGYRAYIDVDSWIDHHLLNVLTFNVDALRLSAFFYKQREGKLQFGPLWDFDRALYSTDGRDSNPRTWRSNSQDRGTDFFNYTWWDRLFTDPDFYQQYIDRYQELRRGPFSGTNLWRLLDDLTGQLLKAQPRELARWGITPRGGYSGEISRLKNWLTNRVDFMDDQFVQPPVFAEAGGPVAAGHTVVLTSPANAPIYYTLDGTDPRRTGTATGNEIAANAKLYSGPIVVPNNVRIVARSRNPSHTALTGPNNPPLKSIWSGPVAETFVVNPIPIRLTEIMYHPVGDGAASAFQDENFEFIELHNTGSEALDLTGFQLTGVIDFEFAPTNLVRTIAPGGRLLLVENEAAFALRYPGVGPVAGRYRDRLENGNGRLALFGPLKEPVFDFRYTDTWEPTTDGSGPSLVLREENSGPLNPSEATSWRASSRPLGSPGTADPAALVLTPQLVNDAFQLSFKGEPGKTFVLQQTSSLTSGWQPADSKVAAADGSVLFTILPVSNLRLFRVLLP